MLAPSGRGKPSLDDESPEARAARHMRAIRIMVTVLVAIHVGLFIMAVVMVTKVTHTIAYYRTYLAGPLSGPAVATTVENAHAIVAAVRNVTAVAAVAANAGAYSLGFDSPPSPAAPPARDGNRFLLQQTVAPSSEAGASPAQLALADLFQSMARKVDQFDGAAPGHFLDWLTQQQPGPYIREMLTLVRYGEATMATVLAALGAVVNPDIVDTAVRGQRQEFYKSPSG